MTPIGYVIQPGQPIPQDVIRLMDRGMDDWELTERGHWHMSKNVHRCYGEDVDGYSFMVQFAPLTVTAVREQPAEPERRLRGCVERWPDAETGAYDPRCCRFPKSCSATIYDGGAVAEEALEPAAEPQRKCPGCGERPHVGMSCLEAHPLPRHVAAILNDLKPAAEPVPDVLDLVRQYGAASHQDGYFGASARPLFARIEAEVQRLRDERDSVLNNARDLRRMLDAQRERADDAVDSLDRHREAWEAEVERLKATQPIPLVLSLPQVPEGAAALVGGKTGRRYGRVDGWWRWEDDDADWSGNLMALLGEEGSVTVVMREPRTWPKLDAPDASAVRGASGRIWRRVSPTVWACNDDEGGEECENFAALQQYDGPLVEVFDDKDGTR